MKKILLIAALSLFALPAQAADAKASVRSHAKVHSHQHVKVHIGKNHPRRAAPLPLAAGLPALALMGGALVWARRRGEK